MYEVKALDFHIFDLVSIHNQATSLHTIAQLRKGYQ